jgi:hypothetical protein
MNAYSPRITLMFVISFFRDTQSIAKDTGIPYSNCTGSVKMKYNAIVSKGISFSVIDEITNTNRLKMKVAPNADNNLILNTDDGVKTINQYNHPTGSSNPMGNKKHVIKSIMTITKTLFINSFKNSPFPLFPILYA